MDRKKSEAEIEKERTDAMKLSVEDRRKLMDWIMEDARRSADEAAEAFIKSNPSISREDLEDEVIYVRFKAGVARMLELKRVHGFPIARYDRNTKKAYIEYSDGRKEYIHEMEPKNLPNFKCFYRAEKTESYRGCLSMN